MALPGVTEVPTGLGSGTSGIHLKRRILLGLGHTCAEGTLLENGKGEHIPRKFCAGGKRGGESTDEPAVPEGQRDELGWEPNHWVNGQVQTQCLPREPLLRPFPVLSFARFQASSQLRRQFLEKGPLPSFFE